MPYNPALDGVRALSILSVIAFHCSVPWCEGGFIGVDVFFVLSGYLITTLLAAEHRESGIKIGAFYARRALRLYPTLLLLLVAYTLLSPLLWPADDRWLVTIVAASYVMDYALAFSTLHSAIGHTWSLGVEEKFYLLWPLLLPVLLRAHRPIVWLITAFVAATAWRYFVALRWGWAQAYFPFDTHMTGILLGAIAVLTRVKVSKRIATTACVMLAVAVATIPATTKSVSVEGVTLGITFAEFAAVLLVSYAAEHSRTWFLASRPMAYIGRLSYGIYLWHFPVVLLLRDDQAQPWWITLSATLLFSFAMAAICLHFLDAPIRRWREKSWRFPEISRVGGL
jgi:peptidoglycan/LPS O-acetylase OafA/YrhL